VILQQVGENKGQDLCRYESVHCNKTGTSYDAGKRDCRGLMKALKKFHNYVYGVRFLVETDTNTLVHELNLPTNNQPGGLVIRWIAWIRQFDFNVNHVPLGLNGGPHVLSRRPRGEGEPEPEEDNDLQEIIAASLRGIRVERGPELKRKGREYEPFVGLGLVQEYKPRWNEIGEFLGNLNRPERKGTKEMQHFRREATKYLASDGILYRRQKTNEPPAKV